MSAKEKLAALKALGGVGKIEDEEQEQPRAALLPGQEIQDVEMARAHRAIAKRLTESNDLTHAAQAEWHLAQADRLDPPEELKPDYEDGVYLDRHGVAILRTNGGWSRCGSSPFNDATAHAYYAPLKRLRVADEDEVIVKVDDLVEAGVLTQYHVGLMRAGSGNLRTVLIGRVAQAAMEQLGVELPGGK